MGILGIARVGSWLLRYRGGSIPSDLSSSPLPIRLFLSVLAISLLVSTAFLVWSFSLSYSLNSCVNMLVFSTFHQGFGLLSASFLFADCSFVG